MTAAMKNIPLMILMVITPILLAPRRRAELSQDAPIGHGNAIGASRLLGEALPAQRVDRFPIVVDENPEPGELRVGGGGGRAGIGAARPDAQE